MCANLAFHRAYFYSLSLDVARKDRNDSIMTVIATVKQGKLEGAVCQSVLGTSYIAFKGIPFAAPPIGNLRFKDPEPPTPWTGIRDAWSIDVNCSVQVDELPPYNVIGDEDCLYLNVYTTSLAGARPVMVFIHGGGYIMGSGIDKYIKPDYLITKDVVVVTINYRLGVLGFLNLDDEVAAGNQGMKDQVAALKWVQENISNFGGDAKNVTIFGPSAGGASVHLLTLSPLAKGLFHKAICQSGVASCSWASDKSKSERYFKLASILGKDSKDPKEVIEFLRTIPAVQLTEAQFKTLTPSDLALMHLPVGPVVDSKSKNPFLPCPPNELANDSDIPMMIGYTNYEFIMFLKDPSDEGLKKMDGMLQHQIEDCVIAKEPEKITKLVHDIRKHYFDNKPISKETIPSLIGLLSDLYFVSPANGVADERRKKNRAPTYLYQYSYVGDEVTTTNLRQEILPKSDNFDYFPKGASHVDEIVYLFYCPRCKSKNPSPPAVGTKDRATLERLTRMWSNFAKTGNPTPSLDEYVTAIWEPLTPSTFTYFDIGNDLKNYPVEDKLTECYKRNA